VSAVITTIQAIPGSPLRRRVSELLQDDARRIAKPPALPIPRPLRDSNGLVRRTKPLAKAVHDYAVGKQTARRALLIVTKSVGMRRARYGYPPTRGHGGAGSPAHGACGVKYIARPLSALALPEDRVDEIGDGMEAAKSADDFPLAIPRAHAAVLALRMGARLAEAVDEFWA